MQVIGQVAEPLCLERWPGERRSTICPPEATHAQGSDISNHVAKAFLMSAPTADVAIQNGGGTRTDGLYTVVTNNFIGGGRDGFTTFGTVSARGA